MQIIRSCTAFILAFLSLSFVAGIGPVLAATIYNSTDVPKAITTNAPPATSTITVHDTATIIDLNVQLNITHTFDTDLDIFLIAPDGTRIELSTDNGDGGDNYTGTIFDDEAATAITAGSPPFAGSYKPESPRTAPFPRSLRISPRLVLGLVAVISIRMSRRIFNF